MPLCKTPASVTAANTPVPAYGLVNKRIVFLGDSTCPPVADTAATLLNSYTASGQPLDGCTLFLWAENGCDIEGYMSGAVTHSFAALCALSPAPDLIYFGYGINSMRAGQYNQAQFTAYLSSVIDLHVAALPTTAFVLTVPNSWLTGDDGFHLVTPNASAQAYCTIIQNAFAAQAGRYKNVFVNDKAQRVFGRTCQASSFYMGNQLHPNAAGQTAWVNDLLKNFLTQHLLTVAFS